MTVEWRDFLSSFAPSSFEKMTPFSMPYCVAWTYRSLMPTPCSMNPLLIRARRSWSPIFSRM